VIRPSKYLDLGTSVLKLAAIMLEQLHDEPEVGLEDLRERVERQAGEASRFNFFPALNFLYLVGRADYDEERDAVISLLPQGRRAA
jgi:hypothetical protein